MRAAFLAIGAALMLGLFGPVAAHAEDSAQAFLAAIYKTYEGKDSRGVAVDSPTFRKVVTPGLWRLVDSDAKRSARRRKVPQLNGDPFVDAQDWEISGLRIEIKEDGPKATANVIFRNSGQGRAVTLQLVKARDGWRIDDFVGSEGSLRKLLARK
jgi:hypothetical protein